MRTSSIQVAGLMPSATGGTPAMPSKYLLSINPISPPACRGQMPNNDPVTFNLPFNRGYLMQCVAVQSFMQRVQHTASVYASFIKSLSFMHLEFLQVGRAPIPTVSMHAYKRNERNESSGTKTGT